MRKAVSQLCNLLHLPYYAIGRCAVRILRVSKTDLIRLNQSMGQMIRGSQAMKLAVYVHRKAT